METQGPIECDDNVDFVNIFKVKGYLILAKYLSYWKLCGGNPPWSLKRRKKEKDGVQKDRGKRCYVTDGAIASYTLFRVYNWQFSVQSETSNDCESQRNHSKFSKDNVNSLNTKNKCFQVQERKKLMVALITSKSHGKSLKKGCELSPSQIYIWTPCSLVTWMLVKRE